MKHSILLSALVLIAPSLDARAEVVRTKERTYLVTYSDGAAERYLVKWALEVTSDVREVGGSFVPYQGSGNEQRRCTWSVSATVGRNVALLTRIGQSIPVPDMTRKLEGKDRFPDATGQRDEPCSKAAPERERAVGAARTGALDAFEHVTAGDFEELMSRARSAKDVRTVVAQ